MPPPPEGVLEIFLQPGEFHFGDAQTRIRTLLGSCVAIVLWHPRLRIGGMCHFMLPGRARGAGLLDGRYAGDALKLFLRELRRTGTRPADYQAKVFGGGHMFAGASAVEVAAANREAARRLLAQESFAVHAEDMGGHGHRNVVFDVWNGDVWIRRVPLQRGAGATAP